MQQNRTSSAIAQQQTIVQHQYSGPIPPPDALKGYEDVCPGSADRILAMAEREAVHRHKYETEVLEIQKTDFEHDRRLKKRGQTCAIIIGVLGIVAAAIVVLEQFTFEISYCR